MSFKRRIVVLCSLLSLSSVYVSRAATIEPVSSIPLDVGGAFDYSTPGISYALGAGTSFQPPDDGGTSDVRDIFGGTFSTLIPGAVVFADGQPLGTVESVDVTLPEPVTLGSFVLYLQDDEGSKFGGARAVADFQLFAGTTLLDDIPILDTSGTQSYDGVYGGTTGDIELQDTLLDAPAAASYTLEFTQNYEASPLSGTRVDEFGAFAVPEPSGLSLMALCVVGVLFRKNRRRCK